MKDNLLSKKTITEELLDALKEEFKSQPITSKVARRISHLGKELRGAPVGYKAMEFQIFDRKGKVKKIGEIVVPEDNVYKEIEPGKFARNPRKENLGAIRGKGTECLKVSCYFDRPVDEIKENRSFRDNSNRGLLAVSGGVHDVLISLDFLEARKLRNIVDKLIYRLRKPRMGV